MNKNIIAAIIFAIGSVLFFILVLPEYGALGNVKTVIQAKQALVGERTAEMKIFTAFSQQARAHQADISKIATVLPPKKQIDELVSSIQASTVISGLQLSDMTVAEVNSPDQTAYKKVFIGIDLIGQYPAFINLLRSLEQNLRLYDINEISAAVSTQGGGLNFSLKIYAYYLKQ